MEKQKYKFWLTRVRPVNIKYNTDIAPDGTYVSVYGHSSTSLITQADIDGLYFNLGDDFVGRAVKVATFYYGELLGIDNFYLVTEITRQFPIDANTAYIISWDSNVFEPATSSFFSFESQLTHPVFSKISIDKATERDNMCYSEVLNSDLYFKAGTFDYIVGLTNKDALIFKIERLNYSTNTFDTVYKSLPFTKVNCKFDYDRRQLTVDFSECTYKAYLNKRINTTVNIAKHGYKHSTLTLNIPAMLQIYVDGSETITNIVGGSATEIDISYPETPDNFMSELITSYRNSIQPDNDIFWALLPTGGTVIAELLLIRFYASIFNLHPNWMDEKWANDYARILYLSKFGFQLAGRISEIEIVGGTYTEPGSSIINSPAGFYYATTSDEQIAQVYHPTNAITRFNSDSTNWYITFDSATRLIYLHKKSDNSVIYMSTQPVSTSCLLSPDSIAATQLVNINDVNDRCVIRTHNVFNIFSRILTTKKVEPGTNIENFLNVTLPRFSVKIPVDDFAYSGSVYKYFVYNPNEYASELYETVYGGQLVDAHLTRPVPYAMFCLNFQCSSLTELADTGLGSKSAIEYYTYKNKPGSSLQQHYIPIGQYFWSGVSFYAALSNAFVNVLTPWYNSVEQSHFFTVGAAIIEILHAVAPNIKFAETQEYSSILYGENTYNIIGLTSQVKKPDIYLTHISNIQAGIFNYEASRIDLTLKKILDLLRDAFQIYYYIDASGRLHLEHISWFYGLNKVDNIQYNTLDRVDEYSKKLLDYGHGQVSADSGYLYSSIQLAADSEDAFELFKPLKIKCLDALCQDLDKKEVTLGDFKTDIDYIYASASERSDGILMLIPSTRTRIGKKVISYSSTVRCDIKGLNNNPYTLWPTNYKASSYELLNYYRWNFASLSVDHCAFQPIEQARYIIQEIQVPIKDDLDMLKLIQTRFGDGFILSYKIDLDSRFATIKLLHKG
jgi:hypothetical protein